jgi:hypothetical protein
MKTMTTTPLDKKITNREFKLLLKPQGLDRYSRITLLSHLIVSFCQKEGVDFFHLDNANTGLRSVYFFDTPEQDFRKNNLILRVRESRQNVWIDDWCEVTFKCRAKSLQASIAYDPTPDTTLKTKLRLKEEILRGEKPGSTRMIYSNNAIMDSVPVDQIFEGNMGSLVRLFPDLSRLQLKPEVPVSVVGGNANKILEACLPLGNIVFGPNVSAHCDVAIWMRSVGEPIVGELAFSYRVLKTNRDDSAAHQLADKFFKNLQLAIPEWLIEGSTKTALVYGSEE